MVNYEDEHPCTVILEEISGTVCYLNEDVWGMEDLYPEKQKTRQLSVSEKEKTRQLSVSDYTESILSCFASILTFVSENLNGPHGEGRRLVLFIPDGRIS